MLRKVLITTYGGSATILTDAPYLEIDKLCVEHKGNAKKVFAAIKEDYQLIEDSMLKPDEVNAAKAECDESFDLNEFVPERIDYRYANILFNSSFVPGDEINAAEARIEEIHKGLKLLKERGYYELYDCLTRIAHKEARFYDAHNE